MSSAALIEVTDLVSVQLAAFLSLLLLASAVHKLFTQARTRSVVREFGGVPAALAPAVALIIVAAELLVCVLLWAPPVRAAGAALAALIWSGYLLLMVRAIGRGRRDLDCGCSFGAAHAPLGMFHLWRNTVLTGLAVLVAAASSARGGLNNNAHSAIKTAVATVASGDAWYGVSPAMSLLAALALLALYGALDQVMALRPLRRGELL